MNKNNKEKVYPFIIGISLLFLLIFYFTQNQVFFFAGISCLAIAAISAKLAELVFSPIIRLFQFIGKINSYLILGVFFLLFLTPLALMQRIFSKRIKSRNLDKKQSFFHEDKHKYSSEDFNKSW